MPTNLKIAEKAFRFGCGRYMQGDGVLAEIGSEVKRLHGKKAFVMGTKSALATALETIKTSFEQSGIEYDVYTYVGFCTKETCAEIMNLESFQGADTVVGVGGGNVCDAAKYVAVTTDKPIINVPTSSATCASFTPLSVFYTPDGRTIGSIHHPVEVNCVIADMNILSKQPVRLALAGIYDALAKKYEIEQRMLGIAAEEAEIGLASSYFLSKFLCDNLEKKAEEFCNDLENGKNTKIVSDMVFLTIALTGEVSGITRGSNQTAIAHKVYESLRKIFPREVYSFLHGEMVGIGLISQIEYNGTSDADSFRSQMEKYGMKTRISELGVPDTDENIRKIYDAIVSSSAMAGTDENEKMRLWKSLQKIR